MRLLAHRGWWSAPDEKNTEYALKLSIDKGFGIETDLRDFLGKPVIAHDVTSGSELSLEVLLRHFANNRSLCFAMNIKADGLLPLLQPMLTPAPCEYFVFDMSIPQMVEYRNAGIRYFTRISDLEPNPVLYEECAGVWLDSFGEYNWIDVLDISVHLSNGKQVCIVSPELHGLDPIPFWTKLRAMRPYTNDLLLCTDIVNKAVEFLDM